MDKKPRIKSVFVFPNKNVAVCGYDDQQMPELQGTLSDELMERIVEQADEDTEWNGWKP